MHSKEDPEDFIELGPGLDFVQAVLLFFGSKATLHSGCSFLTEFSCYDLSMILILSGPAFSFDVRGDLLAGAPLPVGIVSRDVVSRDVNDLSKQGAAVPD